MAILYAIILWATIGVLLINFVVPSPFRFKDQNRQLKAIIVNLILLGPIGWVTYAITFLYVYFGKS